jgi:xanthine dehydrogenase large subunit
MTLTTLEKNIHPLPHDSADSHSLGQSEFIDDRLPLPNEVFCGIYYSHVAKGKIKKINIDECLKSPGVLGVFTGKDIAHNEWGAVRQDQPVLAENFVQYYGEAISLVVAENPQYLAAALKLISVEWDQDYQKTLKLNPPIFNITEAIKQNSFLDEEQTISRFSNPNEKNLQHDSFDILLKKSPYRLKGILQTGGQEHFYLESQSAITYPGENGTLSVHSSSQHPTEVQHVVAKSLGLYFHQVNCVVKRMGGGFGGKESQASQIAALSALAAHKFNRPSRLVLSKDDDMMITGKRHPYLTQYEVGFDETGKIQVLKVYLYSDGGAYLDLSAAVLQRSMLHIDNAYFLPNVLIKARVCKTNLAPNTAFRGFGGPQGVMVIENIMEEIAIKLGIDSYKVRLVNCYSDKLIQTTPYLQPVIQNPLPELFSSIGQKCHYEERRIKILEFNKNFQKSCKIRGISLTAVKFGISFTARFLNQGNALVLVQTDGGVQVSTGATEMGQGVNTKIKQIVAHSFSIDPHLVRIMPTNTEKNHNTSATAASSGTDINGFAAQDACEKIKRRLKFFAHYLWENPNPSPIDEVELPGDLDQNEPPYFKNIIFKDGHIVDLSDPTLAPLKFKDLVSKAYFQRVRLGEYGFYKTPHLNFNRETGTGNPFLYFTNGVAASEVEINTLTGEMKVLRSDILMDLGRPINEGIDQGQIAGAYIQGLGWVSTEELCYNSEGALLTHSPTTYKIPSIQDIPRQFNIDFYQSPFDVKNVRGSKAVGEPPFVLGISIWTAIKFALASINEKENIPNLKLPATSEEILNHLPEFKVS